jgi:Arc/MetJ family transcription regulator
LYKKNEMLTNIDIDQKKIAEIMSITKIKTKKEAVDKALEAFLKVVSAQEILKMKGSNIWEGDLNEIRAEK